MSTHTQQQEDHYKTLGVSPQATEAEILHAYRQKAKTFHPDFLKAKDVPHEVVLLAEEQMKAVNRAYEVLGDPERRVEYDRQKVWRTSPPRPVVDPPYIRFDNVIPGVNQTASFVVRNIGGPCGKITIGKPNSWISEIRWGSLTDSEELPLRVEIDASGQQWGTTYAETIPVRLDDQEAHVKVELRTRPAPVATTVPSPGARPAQVTPTTASSATRTTTPTPRTIPQASMAAPVLPWPSFGWQQVALVGAAAAGTVAFATGLGVIASLTEFGTALAQALATSLIGLFLALVAVYGGWTTGWLQRTQAAPLSGRVAAGTSVGIVTGAAVISAVVAVISVAVIVLMLVAVFWALAAFSKK
jgi:hypothetical protein